MDSAGERPRKVRAWVVRGARGRRLGPSRPSGIGCSLSPASRDPRSPSPAHTPGARLERGEGTRRAEEGGRGRLVHAPRSLRCASSALPPPASPSFPPPSVCLPLALSVCSAAPRLTALGLARSCPSACRARSRRARPGRPEPQPGAHCPAVRLSGGGAQGPGALRSAEAPGKGTPDSFPPGPG